MEICSPCCLIFPPLATFPGTAPLPHRVAQAGLAWPQRACQVCSLSSSPSNLFPYACSMDSVLQITRAPLPPATVRIQETFNLPVCILQKGVMLPRPAMCHLVFFFFFFYMKIVLRSKLGYCPRFLFQVELKDSPLKISFWYKLFHQTLEVLSRKATTKHQIQSTLHLRTKDSFQPTVATDSTWTNTVFSYQGPILFHFLFAQECHLACNALSLNREIV